MLKIPQQGDLPPVTVSLNKYNFDPASRTVASPTAAGGGTSQQLLPDDVQRMLNDAAERRLMALGSLYKYLQPSESQLKDIESELRRTKLFETMSVAKSMRRAELDRLRRLMMEEPGAQREEAQTLAAASHRIRQQAAAALQRELASIKAESAEQLGEDRRTILQRERQRLMERRREFEQRQGPAMLTAGGGGGGNSLNNSEGPPALALKVALGNGSEETLYVRRGEDPYQAAFLFTRQHGLPESAWEPLARQIAQGLHLGPYAPSMTEGSERGATPVRSRAAAGTAVTPGRSAHLVKSPARTKSPVSSVRRR